MALPDGHETLRDTFTEAFQCEPTVAAPVDIE
jgi:hypothetical protein